MSPPTRLIQTSPVKQAPEEQHVKAEEEADDDDEEDRLSNTSVGSTVVVASGTDAGIPGKDQMIKQEPL